MWKSASGVISSKIGSSGGEKSGSIKNGRSGLTGQLDLDSIRQLWETAMDGVESSAWEGVTEELLATNRTSIPSNTSSSSSQIARQGGKLFQVVRRKVKSSGTKKESQSDRASVHDGKDSSPTTNSRTQEGEIVSDKLLEELEMLRRKLEKKEKEMQKLKNEVSNLRLTTAIRSVQPQSQSQAQAQAQAQASSWKEASHCESFDSDSSQLSCLDFSLASSTGDLKYEGKIKTKITADFNPWMESEDQLDLIFSDKATIGATQLSQPSEVFAPDEVRSTPKGSASSHVQDQNIVDRVVESTKKRLGSRKAETNWPEDAARVSRVPGRNVTEGLHISTQIYDYKSKDEFSDYNSNESLSPPKNTSSTVEEDTLELPIKFTVEEDTSELPIKFTVEEDTLELPIKFAVEEDTLELPIELSNSKNPFVLQKTTSSKVSDFDSVERSSCNRSHPDDDEKPYQSMMKDGEEVDKNALTVTLNSFRNRCLNILRQPLDSEVKAVESIEQPEIEGFLSNRMEVDLASKISPLAKSEESMEPMTGSDGLDFDNLPLPKSHKMSSSGSTGPQSFEHTRTIGDRRGSLPLLLPSTSPRATATAGRPCEGQSPISPSISQSGGGLAWKTKSGSLLDIKDLEEEVRQILEQSRLLLTSDENRLLLTSDENSKERERSVSAPASRDQPFSVLAASRQRRSMEKNRISCRHSSEMNQQQERQLQQGEEAIVLYGDFNAWDIQSSKVDNFPEQDADEDNDDHSLSRAPNAVEAAYKKKDDLQLVWELEVQNSKNQIMSSLHRRSRFFFEANLILTPEVV